MLNSKKIYTQLLFNGCLYIAINNDYSNLDIRHKSLSIAKTVVDNGCDILQYRARNISYFKMLDEAKAMSQICANAGTAFIINNHIDLAFYVKADGVHLSHQDVSVAQARAILGADKIIGLTLRSLSEVENIDISILEMLDYVSIAGVFSQEKNLTEQQQQPLGLAGLKQMLDVLNKKMPNLATVGIGGIDENNVEQVLLCGADSISVVSAISQAAKPAMTCRKIKRNLTKALKIKTSKL